VEFNSWHRLTVSSKPCCSPPLKITQAHTQKITLGFYPPSPPKKFKF
jgi:hypothetical protein